jgi:phosphohistidine phosphatase
MRTLFLLRHAKSSWDDAAQRDFDRPLNARGHDAARTIGRAMRARGFAVDAILASPARRVVETLDGLQQALGWPLDVEFDESLYHASAGHLLHRIRATATAIDRLLVVGHNPGLHDLLHDLVDPTASRDASPARFVTGALAECQLPVERWTDVAAGKARLIALTTPRSLTDKDPG